MQGRGAPESTSGQQVLKTSASDAGGWGCAVIALIFLLLGGALFIAGFCAQDLIDAWGGNVIQHGGTPGMPLYILGSIFCLIGGGWMGVEVISAVNRKS